MRVYSGGKTEQTRYPSLLSLSREATCSLPSERKRGKKEERIYIYIYIQQVTSAVKLLFFFLLVYVVSGRQSYARRPLSLCAGCALLLDLVEMDVDDNWRIRERSVCCRFPLRFGSLSYALPSRMTSRVSLGIVPSFLTGPQRVSKAPDGARHVDSDWRLTSVTEEMHLATLIQYRAAAALYDDSHSWNCHRCSHTWQQAYFPSHTFLYSTSILSPLYRPIPR